MLEAMVCTYTYDARFSRAGLLGPKGLYLRRKPKQQGERSSAARSLMALGGNGP